VLSLCYVYPDEKSIDGPLSINISNMRMGMTDFGEGRKPCWVTLDCPKYVYPDCLAYQCPEKPCWENEYTQNEVLLDIKRECRYCKVFKIYNNDQG
jgi:hypothetical protein